jgi:hypothetical protein
VTIGARVPNDEPGADTRIYRPRGAGPRLRILHGPPGAAGREFALEGPAMTIGRRADQDIELGPAGAAIVDLGSTNGTVVNGLCLRGTRTALRGGERIEIGAMVLEFLAPS